MLSAPIHVRQATVNDVTIVVDLAQRLLNELGGFQTSDSAALAELGTRMLASGQYTAFLAYDTSDTPVGLLTLQEISALYVAGQLGWLQELYVAPEARSLGAGHQLIKAAQRYGRERGWQRLEVNTPDADAWPRTVAFYRREGFQGGSYHLRLPLA